MYIKKSGNIAKQCHVCKRQFACSYRAHGTKYCLDCKRENKPEKISYNSGYSSPGYISEAKVVLDLVGMNHFVYTPIQRFSRFDLAVEIQGKIYSVEVKTGHYGLNGKLIHPKIKTRPDITAIVVHEKGKIIYFPEIKTLI